MPRSLLCATARAPWSLCSSLASLLAPFALTTSHHAIAVRLLEARSPTRTEHCSNAHHALRVLTLAVVVTGADMMWSYLSTYRIFAPPLQLLKMWMGMYTTYAADSDDYSREFNHRMVLFMRYWVDHFFDQDFKYGAPLPPTTLHSATFDGLLTTPLTVQQGQACILRACGFHQQESAAGGGQQAQAGVREGDEPPFLLLFSVASVLSGVGSATATELTA